MPSTARDWMLTISAEKHTQQAVEELLDVLGAYIFQQEEGGETGYPHFQAFLQLQSPIHMKTLKNKFKKAGFKIAFQMLVSASSPASVGFDYMLMPRTRARCG